MVKGIILAAATSLPELSTGLTSIRLGDYKLAISDIFGGNASRAVPAGHPALREAGAADAHNTDIYLTALGIVLTIVFMTGLIFRPRRQYLRMGIDSIAVLIIYLTGIVGLATIGS